MPNEYDRLLKEIFGQLKATLVKLLFNIEAVSIRPLVSKFQQSILEKEADAVAEITSAAGEQFIIHIEWQTTNDKQMAERMLLYNNLLRLKYGKPVLGIVVYLGKEKLRMKGGIRSFGLNYKVTIKDVRDISPNAFLQSEEPADWIFAILAGHEKDKTKLIREILFKLHTGLQGEPGQLSIKLKQLEILSLLKGQDVQQQIIKEEQTMPVTIDITKDLRYQAEVEKGRTMVVKNLLTETSFTDAKIAILAGVPESFVKKVKKIN